MPKSFYARYNRVILLMFVFLTPVMFAGARRALRSNKNDVKEWLPAAYEETQEFNWFRKYFIGEQFVLVSWEGCTLDDPRLEMFAKKLIPKRKPASKEPRLFTKVRTGKQLLEDLTRPPSNLSREKAIKRLEDMLIGPDHEQTCAVVTLSEEGGIKLRAAVQAIRDTAAEACAVPREDIRLGGPPVDNVALDETGEKSIFRLAAVSAVIGLLVSWWCLRNGRLIALVFATGIFSAACSLSVVWYTHLFGYIFGYQPLAAISMNAILLTMPTLVYVAATSGAIHLANYYRETVDEDGAAGAAGRAVRHAVLPLSLATGTTAVGLLSLCYSELVPIQMFGLFSAIGVGLSFVILVTLPPAFLEMWPLPSRKLPGDKAVPVTDPILSPRWNAVGQWIIRRQAWVSVACLAALAFCGYGLNRIETSVNLMRFFADNSEIVQHYQWLEKHLGPLVPMEVVIRVDPKTCRLNMLERMQLVERIQRRVEGIEDVGNALSAVTFAPDLHPKGFLKRTQEDVLNKRLEQHREDFKDYLRQGDGEELWRISARVAALKNVDYGTFVQEIKAHVEPELAAEREKGVKGLKATYTGLVPLVYKAQHSLLDGLVYGFIGDWILIALVMMFAVRAWSAGVLLMLPSVFPAVIVFGLMGWLGILVDTGTVMTPAVALGVTVDDVVHFMLWFKAGLQQGMDRPRAIMLAYKSTAQAMYQSWGVIGLGLSVFALSPFMPTKTFGYMMITLLTVSLVGNLVLLPALLASPLGAIFSWQVRRRAARSRPDPSHKVAPRHEAPAQSARVS